MSNVDVKGIAEYHLGECNDYVIGKVVEAITEALQAQADTIEQLQPQLEAASAEWIPVSERLPESGKKVIAFYKNSMGKERNICAMWCDKFTIEHHENDDLDMEYCEEKDCYYWPSGWYECIDNWDDYSAVVVHEGEITHWQPLPTPPNQQERSTCK